MTVADPGSVGTSNAAAVPDLNQAPSSEPDADMAAAIALSLVPDEVPVSGSRNNRPTRKKRLFLKTLVLHNAPDGSSEDSSAEDSSAEDSSAEDSSEAVSDDNSYSGNKRPMRGAHRAKKRNNANARGPLTAIWNRTTMRKVLGRGVRYVQSYLSKHPDCEVYNGQDKLLTPDEKLIRSQHQRPLTQQQKDSQFESGSRHHKWKTTDLAGQDLPVFTSQSDKRKYLENQSAKDRRRKRAHSEINMQEVDVHACLSTADSVVSAISSKLREAQASFLRQPYAKIGAHWAGVRKNGDIRKFEYKVLFYRGERATYKRLTDADLIVLCGEWTLPNVQSAELVEGTSQFRLDSKQTNFKPLYDSPPFDESKQTGHAAKGAPDGSCKVYAFLVLSSPWLQWQYPKALTKQFASVDMD